MAVSTDPEYWKVKDTVGRTSPSHSGTKTPSVPGGDPSNLVDLFKSTLSDLPYYNTSAFQNIVNRFSEDPNRTIQNQGNATAWKSQLQGWANTFANQFKNTIGRDPTESEYNTFFEQVVNPTSPWLRTADQSVIQQGATGLMSSQFSSLAQEEAKKKAELQTTEALRTGGAFDQWQNSYRDSVNTMEKSLQDYQARLFEKVRPQLITSLQSQGLLNTGALNEAFAGTASDFANEASRYSAGARSAAESDIANRRYDIASAPGNFALSNTFSAVPNLQASGEQALQNAYSRSTNFDLAEKNFQNYQSLNNRSQPSLLQQYAGQILGGAAAGYASGGFGR